jgi:hypothetical protein
MDESSKPMRSSPYFIRDNRNSTASPQPIAEAEASGRISTRLRLSVKAQFDALPGTASQKLRHAVDLLLQKQQSENMPNPDVNAKSTEFSSVVPEGNLLVLAASKQTLSSEQWKQLIQNERQERLNSFVFDPTHSSDP